MPALSLSCRVCATEHPLEATGTCTKCFGPLDPTYDWDALRARVSRASIEAGPPSIWRYADLLPVAAPDEPRLAPGLTPLVPAPRLAEELGIGELWLKLDTANPTHSFKDRVVAVAARKAQELGFDTLSCSSTGNLAGAVAARAAAEGLDAAVFVPADLEPEKLAAAAVYGPRIYAVDGTYDHCSRLSVELSFELPWGFVNVNLRSYYAEGSKTLAYEIAEQLGWETPDAVAIPIASGALYHKVGQGFSELQALGLVDGRHAGALRRSGGRAASRWRPRSARAAASCPCGRTASRARWRSATRPTATSPSRRLARPAEPSTRSPRRRSARTWPTSPRPPGSSARPRPGVALGALRGGGRRRPPRAGGAGRPARHRRRAEDARPRRAHLRADRDRGGRGRIPRRRARRRLTRQPTAAAARTTIQMVTVTAINVRMWSSLFSVGCVFGQRGGRD